MKYDTVPTMNSSDLISTIIGGKPSPDVVNGLTLMVEDNMLGVAREAGITIGHVSKLEAALELGRRMSANQIKEERPQISTPDEVARLMAPMCKGLDREHFWALALNTKNRLIRIIEVSIGSLNASIVHPRELFKDAVRASAASIIVVHNHPSGDPTPSGADIMLSKRLAKGGEVLGIEVLDHVVIGDPEHSSLRDLGLM